MSRKNKIKIIKEKTKREKVKAKAKKQFFVKNKYIRHFIDCIIMIIK